jgi:hypothetical protein
MTAFLSVAPPRPAAAGVCQWMKELKTQAIARDLGPDASLWTMPPIESLPPPLASRARTVGLVVLRCYLLLAALAVIVKLAPLIVR